MAPSRVLITRPAQDVAILTELLQARGCEVVNEPLLSIHFLNRTIDFSDVQAVLITSSNGARALAAATTVRAMPVFTVGNTSAQTCHTHGFIHVTTASGDVANLVQLVVTRLRPENGTLLHATGSITAGDLSGRLSRAGFFVRKIRLYVASTTTALSPTTAKMIFDSAINTVLFYSPRTALTFTMLVSQANIQRGLAKTSAYCLSETIRYRLLELPWQLIRVATEPNQESLLAMFDSDQSALIGNQNHLPINGERGMTIYQSLNESKDDNVGEEGAQKSPVLNLSPALAVSNQSETAGQAQLKSGVFSSPQTSPQISFVSNSSGRKNGEEEDIKHRDSNTAVADYPPDKIIPPILTLESLTTSTIHSSKRRDISRLAVTTVILLGLVGVGGSVTLPWWCSYIPETYRACLLDLLADDTHLIELKYSNIMLRHDLDQLTSRLDSHRTHSTMLEQRFSVLETATTELAHKVIKQPEALANQVMSLDSRVSDVNNKLDAMDRERVSAATVASIYDRIATSERTIYHAIADENAALAWLLTVAQLREAVYRGTAFLTELQAVRALASNSTAVERMVAGFIAYASVGLPTYSAIEARFDNLNSKIVHAVVVPNGSNNWIDRIFNYLLTVVTIHHTNNNVAAGNSVPEIMARAGAAIHTGDLVSAVREMEILHAEPAKVAEPWVACARAHVAADTALSNLTVHTIERATAEHTKTDR